MTLTLDCQIWNLLCPRKMNTGPPMWPSLPWPRLHDHASMTLTFCRSLLTSTSHVSGIVGLIATKHKNKFHLLNVRHQMWAGYYQYLLRVTSDDSMPSTCPPKQTSNLSKWFGYIFPFTFSQNSNVVGGTSPKLRIWRNSWRCGMHVASKNVTCIVVSRKVIGLRLSFIHQEQGW